MAFHTAFEIALMFKPDRGLGSEETFLQQKSRP